MRTTGLGWPSPSPESTDTAAAWAGLAGRPSVPNPQAGPCAEECFT